MSLLLFDLHGWLAYAGTAAGFLFILAVSAAVWSALENRRKRKAEERTAAAIERIEAFLSGRFGRGRRS